MKEFHMGGKFLYRRIGYRALKGMILVSVFFFCAQTSFATIHEYKDTLSNSAPSYRSNHTVEFKTTSAIQPGGTVQFTPESGDFTIPGANFDIDNVEMAVATSSGYITRAATSTVTADEDGITITPGTSGDILVTLNSSVGIPANAYIRLRMGTHTANATGTDLGIINPSSSGSYRYTIEAGDGVMSDDAIGMIAVIDAVTVGPADSTETVPPVRFNGAPSGTISGTSITVQISLETDEFAKCRYSTASNTPFFTMGNEFTSTFKTIHPKNVAVATGTSYTFFVRCIDDEGNINIDDYEISFTVPEYPEGTPGGSGEGEGEGTGGGSGSGSSGSGSGSSGGSGSGAGESGGGSSGAGGSGGGGGSSGPSGNDSGGLDGTVRPYQSGDGLVIITGFAFPRSEVIYLVDGQIAVRGRANADGAFTEEIEDIARGVYTFGVYAVDENGVRSSTYATTFSVTGARGSTLSNVNIMPSIAVKPNPVTPGGVLTVSGFAIPNALVTLEHQNDKSSASLKTYTAQSNASGAWSLTIDTTGFTTGTYKVRAKAKQETGVSTNFSNYTYYGVGAAAKLPTSSDLNRDSKVNLTDFSILLFWWGTAGGNSNPPADINQDGKVSLTDFSIMIFNWTG